MTKAKRPRVAVIGLDDAEVASIAALCGDLREADSLSLYLQRYSWVETDIVVLNAHDFEQVATNVNLMAIGFTNVYWSRGRSHHYLKRITGNTERELAVPSACPDVYQPLAAQMARQLSGAAEPPAAIETSRKDKISLVETTSGHPVALRLGHLTRPKTADGEQPITAALLLPKACNLVAWFRAFLCDLHEVDPVRVPHAPPRLSEPSDWHTPQEKDLADRIRQIECELNRLDGEQDRLQRELAAEGERADMGLRRVLWADGDDLTAAVREILTALGFGVRDMDAELSEGEPRREDLRLTRDGAIGWQAMVEVKGYTSGTKTNDARQIREHRDRYAQEEGRVPDLTVWLSNPHRRIEPSSRPAPDQNVRVNAENVGAVHVLASDLYRQWALVATGSLDAETVIQSLVNADPGLWSPPSQGTGT